jgi:hypothetical protein
MLSFTIGDVLRMKEQHAIERRNAFGWEVRNRDKEVVGVWRTEEAAHDAIRSLPTDGNYYVMPITRDQFNLLMDNCAAGRYTPPFIDR